MSASTHTGGVPEDVVRAVIDLAVSSATADKSDLSALSESLVGLYAEPTHVVHPLRPDLPPLVHRDDSRRHAATVRQNRPRPQSFRALDIVVHPTTDPELIVTEFRYEMVVDGETLVSPCIWVTRVRDGSIVEARDYNGEPRPVTW